MLKKLPTRKKGKDSKSWDPIHFHIDDIDPKWHDIINKITVWINENEPKAYIMQVTENFQGDLVIHAEGSNNLQWFIYKTLKKYDTKGNKNQ